MTSYSTIDSPPPAAPPAPDRPPLGPRFLRVWLGQTISTVGSSLSAVGVAVFVYLETGNAAWLGALAALAAVPYVLVGPFLAIADRFSRRSVMIAADMVAALGPLTALTMAATGRLQIWHLVLAGFVGGLGTAVQTPISTAAMPGLVAPESLGRANGLAQLGPAIGIVAGPVLATPLLMWKGVEAVLVADLATFAFGTLLTVLTPFADAVDDTEVADDGSWRSAWCWLRTTGRPLLVLLASLALINFSLSFFNLALLVVATSVGGASRAGVILGVGGAAMVAGSLVVAATGVSKRPLRAASGVLVLIATGIAIVGARPAFAVVTFGVAVALVGVPVVNAAVATVFHREVPARMQGRVFGLRSTIGQILGPVGSVTAGLVLAHLAAPALDDGGTLSTTVGRVIGTGPDRGAALMMLAVAPSLAILAVSLRASRAVEQLDQPVSDVTVENPACGQLAPA